MADLIIRGMEMPQENEILVFDVWHGKMYARSTANTGARRYEVVSLPAGHGRLVDTREVLEKADKAPWFDGDASELGFLLGSEVTTIIPAEGDGNNV